MALVTEKHYLTHAPKWVSSGSCFITYDAREVQIGFSESKEAVPVVMHDVRDKFIDYGGDMHVFVGLGRHMSKRSGYMTVTWEDPSFADSQSAQSASAQSGADPQGASQQGVGQQTQGQQSASSQSANQQSPGSQSAGSQSQSQPDAAQPDAAQPDSGGQ